MAGDAGPVPGADAAPVPWAPDTLKPLFEQVVPALEKWDVSSLVKRAARIDEAVAREVAKDAPWNPAAKASLIASGPLCAAEVLDEIGIGQERAHWVVLLIAAGSIYAGHVALAAKLAELEGRQAAEAKPADAP